MITYILKSMSIYHIGKREGVAWYGLAWVPGLRRWVMGSIADKHDAHVGRPDRNFRIFSLIIIILDALALLGVAALAGTVFTKIGTGIQQGAASGTYFDAAVLGTQFFAYMGGLGLLVFLLLAVAAVLGSAAAVVEWICRYKLFDLCRPSDVLLNLVISAIFPGLGYAIVLMCNKNYVDDYPEYIGPDRPAIPENSGNTGSN